MAVILPAYLNMDGTVQLLNLLAIQLAETASRLRVSNVMTAIPLQMTDVLHPAKLRLEDFVIYQLSPTFVTFAAMEFVIRLKLVMTEIRMITTAVHLHAKLRLAGFA